MALFLVNHSFLESGFDAQHEDDAIKFIEKLHPLLANLCDTDQVDLILSGYANRCREVKNFLGVYPIFSNVKVKYDNILGGIESYSKGKVILGNEEVLESDCVRLVDRDPRFFSIWNFFQYEVIERYPEAKDTVCCCTRQLVFPTGRKKVQLSSLWKVDMQRQKLICFMKNGYYLENARKLMAR